MNDQQEFTTLQRKAGVGRAPSEVTGMTPDKALRLAVSRAAQDELSMSASVLDIQQDHLKLADMLETLNQDHMLLLLEGPHGARGLITCDVQSTAAVIEVQTMGKVLGAQAAPRKATRTDSAMCKTVLNRCLQEFEQHLAGSNAQSWATGYRFGDIMKNLRLLGLALADVDYRIFRISLDMADGAKQGEWCLVLPAAGSAIRKPDQDDGDNWTQILEKSISVSHVELSAVLHRLHVPLDQIRAYQVGDLVPVPKSAVFEVKMEGLDGRVVGQAKLGKLDGFRALRMTNGAAVLAGPDETSSLVDLMADVSPETSTLPEMGAVAQMDALPELAPLPDPLAAGDVSDLALDMPMAPMGDLPALDGDDIPVAAMPMELEIS